MPTKPTFTSLHRDGSRVEKTYEKLVVIAGSTARTLALHKEPSGTWTVSDPVSGAAVVPHVTFYHRGMPCTSRGASVKEAIAAGLAAVEQLIERIGSDRFNKALDNPKPF